MSDIDKDSQSFDTLPPTNDDREPSGHVTDEEKSNTVGTPEKDPNVVDWDGPDDPANPMNWSSVKRSLHIMFVSVFTLYANLAATMFAPGAEQLAIEFHITSATTEALAVSIYVAGFIFGPLFLAPLSELYGRLSIYLSCIVVYTGFTAGCAFATDTGMFLAFRIICGAAASGPMSIGGGTVADLTLPEARGAAMALFAIGPLLGPVIGPVIGGFVTENIGWRWTFRLILIMSGVLGIASFAFLRETNAAVLLRRKARRLQKQTGNTLLVAKVDATTSGPLPSAGQTLLRAVVRPTKMLIFSPIVLLVSLYTALIFGLIFLLFTTLPGVMEETYHFDAGIAGLTYLGLGLGMIIGLVIFAIMSDKLLGQKNAPVSRPEMRLILMKWFAPITPLGCFMYGWSTYYKVQWIVPIIGTFIIGFGAIFVVIPAQTYLVDCFGSEAAASALAANLALRSPFGAFLVLVASPLYDTLGLGWGNSLLGFICLAFTPVPWLFFQYGEYLRTKFSFEL